jgi:hypothetical protein
MKHGDQKYKYTIFHCWTILEIKTRTVNHRYNLQNIDYITYDGIY